jgi:hypothetical protein
MGAYAADMSHADRDLSVELAGLILERVAPEEVVVLDETAAVFFEDPSSLLGDRKDEALGSAIDVEFLAPYVLAVAGPVLRYLVAIVAGAVRDEAKPQLVALVRRLFRRENSAEPIALTAEQARTVRQLAIDHARKLGLNETKAGLLGDALIGSLVVAG